MAQTAIVCFGELQNAAYFSPLAHVVCHDKRTAASAASGMKRASGAANSKITSSVSAWTIPAIGVFAPERMLVAVRAMAPVAGMPPNIGVDDVRDSLGDQLRVGIMLVAGHAVGNHGREQALDRSQAAQQSMPMAKAAESARGGTVEWNWRKASRNAAELTADGLDRQTKECDDGGGREERDDGPWNAPHQARKKQNDAEGTRRNHDGRPIQRIRHVHQYASSAR